MNTKMTQEELDRCFNKVDNLIAVGRPNTATSESQTNIVDGKKYKITYIGSTETKDASTSIILEGDDRIYDIKDFDIYEDKVSPEQKIQTKNVRFWSPESRTHYQKTDLEYYNDLLEQPKVGAIRTILNHLELTYGFHVVLAVENGDFIYGLNTNTNKRHICFVYRGDLKNKESSSSIINYEENDLKFYGIDLKTCWDNMLRWDLSLNELLQTNKMYYKDYEFWSYYESLIDEWITYPVIILYFYKKYVEKNLHFSFDDKALYPCLYGVTCWRWIIQYKRFPPKDFKYLLQSIKYHIPLSIKTQMCNLFNNPTQNINNNYQELKTFLLRQTHLMELAIREITSKLYNARTANNVPFQRNPTFFPFKNGESLMTPYLNN